MPPLKPDFTEAADYSALPDGTYPVRVTQGLEKTKQDGSVFVAWTLKIFNADVPQRNGRNIFYNTPLTGPFAWTLQKLLMSAMDKYDGGEFEIRDVIGKTMEVTIQTRPGDKFPIIKNVVPYVVPGSLGDAFDSFPDMPA